MSRAGYNHEAGRRKLQEWAYFLFIFLSFFKQLFATDFTPHPAMVTKKVRAEAKVPLYFSGKSVHDFGSIPDSV